MYRKNTTISDLKEKIRIVKDESYKIQEQLHEYEKINLLQ